MYCYKGKQIKVWPDNNGGLWFYDDIGHACTVKEDRVEQCEEFEILQGLREGKEEARARSVVVLCESPEVHHGTYLCELIV